MTYDDPDYVHAQAAWDAQHAGYELPYVDRCDDCGIAMDRHGDECGQDITDPRYVPPPLGWVTP